MRSVRGTFDGIDSFSILLPPWITRHYMDDAGSYCRRNPEPGVDDGLGNNSGVDRRGIVLRLRRLPGEADGYDDFDWGYGKERLGFWLPGNYGHHGRVMKGCCPLNNDYWTLHPPPCHRHRHGIRATLVCAVAVDRTFFSFTASV